MPQEEGDALAWWGRRLGFEMTEAQVGALLRHLDCVWHWNQKMNLTGLRSRWQMLLDLTFDAMVAVPHLPDTGQLLDVGSGAGFPAIPLKILKPDLEVHLIEANRKKAAFLKQVIRTARLAKTGVFNTRVESHPDSILANRYDRITARALAPLERTLQWCSPFLGQRGRMILFLGSDAGDALEKYAALIKAHHLHVTATYPYLLPGKTRRRHLVLLAKEV